MNNDLEPNYIYACKCIYNSLNINVYAFNNDVIAYYPPKNSVTAEKVLFDRYPKISILDRNTRYQIVKNDYQESYFIVSIKENNFLIVIGPFLTERITEGTLSNMIRKNLISFHKRTEIKDYYSTLQILDEDRIFYTSKLIENIFDNIENKNKVNKKEVNKLDIQRDELYNRIKENRFNAFSHSTYSDEMKVSETIKNGDTEKAKELLKQINLTPHAKLATDSIRSYKNSMICSCTFMTRAAISGGANPDEAFTLSDIYINKIENIQDIKQLENFESTMVEGFTEMVNNIKTNKYSRPILNAIHYIEDHLCDDIKIKDIASASYLNSSYLSNLFHKETSMTISDWILRKRIEEASFAISNTNEDIADIAFFYHFCSQSYFVKCFKKIMGVTPGEYRKNKYKGTN